LGIDETGLFWIGGSTHEGEELLLLQVQQELQNQFRQPLQLMIAPRHPERVDAVLQLARDNGFSVARRSQLSNTTFPERSRRENSTSAPLSDRPSIIILDTVGELAGFYAAADAAFVGGSLIRRGGHNVLEPVLAGVPVLFGPSMNNFRAAAELVQEAGVGQMIHSETELAETLRSWLKDSSKCAQVIQNAEKLLSKHQGAARRVAEGIVNYEL
jgi:3-deoxy-D-manno-octulosonic-acid transferase